VIVIHENIHGALAKCFNDRKEKIKPLVAHILLARTHQAGTVLSILAHITSLNPLDKSLESHHDYPHFPDNETEAQRNVVIPLRSQSSYCV
jgi:hypothetical protein